MIRMLQNLNGVNVDAQNKAKVEMKRGAFVKVNVATKEIEKAATLAELDGVLVRDFNVTVETSMGAPVSEYDNSQDVVKAGELAGVRGLFAGERIAVSEYTLSEAEAAVGKFLTVTDGKAVASADATKLVSLGFVNDAGHKLIGIKVLA
ncbi:MAG: hypothetical protein ACRCX8_18945 [Sarcina sp.]